MHSQMLNVVFYTRANCELCEQTLADLKDLQEAVPHTISLVDIDLDPALRKKYQDIVPVLEIGAYTLKAPISKMDLEVTLKSARQKTSSKAASVGKKKTRSGYRLNKMLHTFSKRWLLVLNLLVFAYLALPFGAPVLMKAGLNRPASWIYTIYSPMCHQLAFRSWFLFGEQAAYPRELAGTSLTSFQEATGLNESEFFTARNYLGNETVGYKVAICERDVAIYGGIFMAGLFFGMVRTRLKPLPVWAWLLIGIVPIALDGGTQLLSSIPLLSFPARESTPLLRTLTGGLFGVINVWLAYPHVEQSMIETRALVFAKLARATA